MPTESGRPAQLGDPIHGGQMGDPVHGVNEGYAPQTPTYPATPPQPAQLGDPTYGGQMGDGAHGVNEGIPPQPVSAQFADSGASVVLESRSGETWASETADRAYGALSLDITLEANAVADWKIDVPYAPELETWGFATIHVGINGERVFRGQLDSVDTDVTGDATTTLSGPGPLGKMQGDDYSVTFQVGNTEYVDAAIEQFLAEHAPDDLRFRVVTPSDRHRVPLPDAGDGDREFEGSRLKILAELVGRAGMARTVDHSRRDPLLEVFWPGLQRPTPWRTLDLTRSLDLDGYNNYVIVEGALKGDGSGERYRGEAIDHAERRDIAAPEPKTIRQPDYNSDEKCRQVAETELEKALGQRTLSASGEVTPAFESAPPGYYRRVEELEGEGIVDGAALLPHTKTSYTESAGEVSTSAEFEDSDETEDLIRAVVRDGLDVGGLKRADRAYDQPGESLGWNRGYNEGYNG